MRFKALLVSAALAGSLVLGACQEITSDQRAMLVESCNYANSIYADFLAVAETGVIAQAKVDKVNFYVAQVQRFCKNPSTATRTSILVNTALAVKAVEEALRGTSSTSTTKAYQKLDNVKRFMEQVK